MVAAICKALESLGRIKFEKNNQSGVKFYNYIIIPLSENLSRQNIVPNQILTYYIEKWS